MKYTLLIYILSTILITVTVVGKKLIERSDNFIQLKTNYTPDWNSLDSRPLPQWYDEAKIGIFIHWGVYSVPSYGSEWFWWYWKGAKNDDYVKYMETNYKPDVTYQEFAKDFNAELFDPNEWADIFEKSGAKYIVLTSKHHDGYALWPNDYSFGWNSKEIGAHKDLVGELETAIRTKTKLHFGLYHSLFEWFNPLWLKDKHSNFSSQAFITSKILPEMKELIERYKPEVFWSDGDAEASDVYWKAKEFLAWLYNESPVRKTIVTNDRWGQDTACKHGDFYTCADRYNPGVLQAHKWENCFTIDKYSWGHRGNAKFEDYLTAQEMIKEIVTTVSCGGNILVNVGPTKIGTLDPIFVERLLQMGGWLKTNGEAIYRTVPWKHQNDSLTGHVWYSASKTIIEDSNILTQNVYATVLKYPFQKNFVELKDIEPIFNENLGISLLGYPDKIKWKRSTDRLIIKFPNKNLIDLHNLNFAWTFKISTIIKQY